MAHGSKKPGTLLKSSLEFNHELLLPSENREDATLQCGEVTKGTKELPLVILMMLVLELTQGAPNDPSFDCRKNIPLRVTHCQHRQLTTHTSTQSLKYLC